MNEDVSNQLDNVWVVLHGVDVRRNPEQSWAETDRQVVRVHHVLVAEF